MSWPTPQTVNLLAAAPLGAAQDSNRIDSQNYSSGMLKAVWSGNDGLDGAIYVQGSQDGSTWGLMGAVLNDVGSVLMDTFNDNQQWAFPYGFPFPFIRVSYAPGTNTTGTLAIDFFGYIKAPGQ